MGLGQQQHPQSQDMLSICEVKPWPLDICWSVIVSSYLTRQVRSTSGILHHFLNRGESKEEKRQKQHKVPKLSHHHAKLPIYGSAWSRPGITALHPSACRHFRSPSPTKIQARMLRRFVMSTAKALGLCNAKFHAPGCPGGTHVCHPAVYLSWMLPTNDGSLTLPPASPRPAMGRL
jgi:hypothetical protein